MVQAGVFPLVPGLPGGPELIIVLFVLILLFGANKIPKLARSTGQAMGEFRKGREDIEDELEGTAEDVTSPPESTSETETETETADEKTA